MARVRIILDEKDGEQGSTWVTSVPVDAPSEWGVWNAVDYAANLFKMSVARDFEAIETALLDAGVRRK